MRTNCTLSLPPQPIADPTKPNFVVAKKKKDPGATAEAQAGAENEAAIWVVETTGRPMADGQTIAAYLHDGIVLCEVYEANPLPLPRARARNERASERRHARLCSGAARWRDGAGAAAV